MNVGAVLDSFDLCSVIPKAMKAFVLSAALVLAVHAALAHDVKPAGAMQVVNAWARPTVPGQPSAAGYLSISNRGTAADRLLSARSPAAEQVELHSMSMEGDVMRMRALDVIELPPGATVKLEPGATHLMLTGLKAPLKVGASVPLKLRFEKAGELDVEMKVHSGAGSAMPGLLEH